VFVASEIIVILRKLLVAPLWQDIVVQVLDDALVDLESGPSDRAWTNTVWAAMSIYGGFFEPLRSCGSVRIMSLMQEEDTECGRGMILSMERTGIKVIVPTTPSHEAEEDDAFGQQASKLVFVFSGAFVF